MPLSNIAGKLSLRARATRAVAGLVLAAGVLSASAPASADFLRQDDFANGSVSVTLTQGPVASATAGGFKGFFAASESALFSSPLLSYCIELVQSFAFDTTYNNYTKVAATAAPNTSPMTVGKANDLAKLLGGGRFADSFTSTLKTAAMQLAIWEIVYDTGKSLTGGSFRAASSDVRTQAQTYLNANTGVAAQLVAFSSATQQDFITVVPVPPSAALLGTGLLFGLWTMRRRRDNA